MVHHVTQVHTHRLIIKLIIQGVQIPLLNTKIIMKTILIILVIGATFGITTGDKTETISTLEDLKGWTVEAINNGHTDSLGGVKYIARLDFWIDKLASNDTTLVGTAGVMKAHRDNLLDRYEQRAELVIVGAELEELRYHLRVLDAAILKAEHINN